MAADAAELKRLTGEFKSSIGFRVHSEIGNNKRSLRIVSRNRDELVQSAAAARRTAGAVESPSEGIAKEELARRLEGFISSAYDLIDYTRRYCRKQYEKTDYSREIQSEIDRRFIFERDFKLAQGLRSISAHVDSIVEGKLQLGQLRTWDEWNDNQRAILEAMNEDIDVQAFCEAYFARLEAFYSWLWKRQGEIHSKDLAEAEALRLRAKEAYDRVFPPPPS
jgi:hypothetical protein